MLSLPRLRYLSKSLESIMKISTCSNRFTSFRYFNQSLSVLTMSEKKVAIINAKLNKGQGKPGTELGPPALKTPFLFENFENLKYPAFVHTEIVDEEDDNKSQPRPDLKAKNLAVASRTNEKLAKAVIKSLKENYTTVVVGGDHSLAIGSVTGTALAMESLSQIGLIWIDAHADINTPLTSASGNLHGQPVSFLLYELDKYFPTLNSFDWQHPTVTARNLVYIGLRDLDPEETFLIHKYKIKTYCMTDVKRLGIHQVVQEALEHLTINGELLPLHVSVDIDVLDPWFAPSTGTPVLGGLTLDELMFIGNRVHETGKLKTLDLVEVNPLLKDSDKDVEKTVFAAQRAILSFFGYTTLGTLTKDSSEKMTRQRPIMNMNN